MAKFIPFDKLSKKKQRELMKKKRVTWGSFNPVTRKPDKPKAYKRTKKESRGFDESIDDGFFFAFLFSETI
ncbi:MAG TPA: hypothetical protein DD733_02805 [Clostridiales bacterium]|nr:hypothetical protein [Eubacteriales bacterium]HBR30993.1 hypothetical protein [Clostridiales bacterium]